MWFEWDQILSNILCVVCMFALVSVCFNIQYLYNNTITMSALQLLDQVINDLSSSDSKEETTPLTCTQLFSTFSQNKTLCNPNTFY